LEVQLALFWPLPHTALHWPLPLHCITLHTGAVPVQETPELRFWMEHVPDKPPPFVQMYCWQVGAVCPVQVVSPVFRTSVQVPTVTAPTALVLQFSTLHEGGLLIVLQVLPWPRTDTEQDPAGLLLLVEHLGTLHWGSLVTYWPGVPEAVQDDPSVLVLTTAVQSPALHMAS